MHYLLFLIALAVSSSGSGVPVSAAEGERVDFEAMAFEAGAALGGGGEVRLQQTGSPGMSRGAKIALGVAAVGALVFVLYSVLAVSAVMEVVDAVPEAGHTGLGAGPLPESPR